MNPPDPASWDAASAGLLDSLGGVLLDVELDGICTGACQPPLPGPSVPLLSRTNVGSLIAMLLAVGMLLLTRQNCAA